MFCCGLFVSTCRLSFLLLNSPSRHFITLAPVAAALHSPHTVCHCRSAMLARRLSTFSSEQNNRATMSFPASSLLVAAVVIPALGIAFYCRKERRKLLKKYEGEEIYETPCVDTKTRLLVRHKGIWFPVVMFPSLQQFEQIRRFALRDDDVLINSFPKSGNMPFY